jgi:hypothetical protein
VSQLLGLFHDTILANPRPMQRTFRSEGYIALGTQTMQARATPPTKPAQVARVASVLLAIITNLQVLLELLMLRKGGDVARQVESITTQHILFRCLPFTVRFNLIFTFCHSVSFQASFVAG